MKKTLLTILFALIPLAAIAAGLNVPQGGTGLSSVPTGNCVKGLDALHLTSGSCGTGSPSGSNGDIQYNNSGSFGGTTYFHHANSANLAGFSEQLTLDRPALQEWDNDFSDTTSILYAGDGTLMFADDNLSGTVTGQIRESPNSDGTIQFDNSVGNWNFKTGAVMIGDDVPEDKFDVNGESAFHNGTYLDPAGGLSFDAKFGGLVGGIAVNGQSIFNSNVGIGSSTPTTKLVVAGTTTVANLVSTTTATSTFAGGVNITHGCLAISGTCLSSSGGGGSGTVNSGTTGQVPYYAANGTTLTATSSLFISTAGNIGIGTTTPTKPLDISKNLNGLTDFRVTNTSTGGSAQSRATFQSSGSLTMDIGLLGSGNTQLTNSNNAGFIWNENNGADIFGTNNSEKMRITPSGNMGIGISSPTALLHINDNLIGGPGTLTDNGDDTISFTNNISAILSVGYVIYDTSTDCSGTITQVIDAGTVVIPGGLCSGSGDSWQYTPNSILNAVNAFGTSRMHITGAGVGIGTETPSNPLTISSDGTSQVDTVAINQTSADAGNIYSNLVFNNTNGLIGNIFVLGSGYDLPAIFTANDMGFLGGQGHAATSMIFMTNTLGDIKFGAGGYATGNEILRISHNGNMGVGTTTPDSKLDVSGSVRFEGDSTVVTGSISGAITGIGCDSATVTGLSGLASTTALVVTPQTDPGNAFFWKGVVLTSTSLKVLVCSDVTATPTASTYNVKIIK